MPETRTARPGAASGRRRASRPIPGRRPDVLSREETDMALLVAELVTPERLMFSGDVRSVLLPAAEGDMTVLPGHVPLVTALLAGIVFATDAAGTGRRAFVSGGLAEVTGERVTILAERVTPMEELNGDRLDQEIAELRLEQDSTGDYERRARCDAAIRRLEEIKASLGL